MPNWICDTTCYKEIIQTVQATTEHPHCRISNCYMDLGGNKECSRSLGNQTAFWVLWSLSPGDKCMTCNRDKTVRETAPLQQRCTFYHMARVWWGAGKSPGGFEGRAHARASQSQPSSHKASSSIVPSE